MADVGHGISQDSLDFRQATGAEALAWYRRQASNMDDAIEDCVVDFQRIAAVMEFLAITSGLVGELLRRVGDEKLRAE